MAKPRYKTTNWKHYNQALINRGSLTFWVDEEAIQLWKQIKQGNRGRPRLFSDLAITTALMMKRIFSMPLRTLQGFIKSAFTLTRIPLKYPALHLYQSPTTKHNKNSYDFTMNWAKSDNKLIKDLKDFTATFFQKETLLEVILRYSVSDISNTLLVMRSYQIAVTERVLWKIKSAYNSKNWSNRQSGGYIWHTTGSGKTLTSFK